MNKLTYILILMGVALVFGSIAWADDTAEEIDYLLGAIGSSDCVFIRNTSRHNAKDAEEHLRMKYRRGKRYAPTAEKFIERLASQSSMSKKLYYIECGNEEKVPSGDWLSQRLKEYRDGKAPEELASQ